MACFLDDASEIYGYVSSSLHALGRMQSKGVAACVKHYALNNDEEYRHQVNVIVCNQTRLVKWNSALPASN